MSIKRIRLVQTLLRQEFETLKKSLNAIEAKKEKVLGLYEEDGVIVKSDLINRLSSLNNEKELLDQRITPIEQQLNQGGVTTISFNMVRK